MSRALFINSSEPHCGVHAYGLNLFRVLEGSDNYEWTYCEPGTEEELKVMVEALSPSVNLVNYQALIGGFLANAPFPWMENPVLVYHDCYISESGWKAILFSDPDRPSNGKWHSIGRPLPEFAPRASETASIQPVVGVHGFLGAWSDQVVSQVIKEFEEAVIRLHLPFSRFCDPNGVEATAMAGRCRAMVAGAPGIRLEVSHEFLPQRELLTWLSQNSINCYFRPVEMHWNGVSSSPDCALAARRPLAVSRCNAFRHLHHTRPSICIEDSSLEQIIRNGLSPLVPLYNAWSADAVREQVEEVLMNL